MECNRLLATCCCATMLLGCASQLLPGDRENPDDSNVGSVIKPLEEQTSSSPTDDGWAWDRNHDGISTDLFTASTRLSVMNVSTQERRAVIEFDAPSEIPDGSLVVSARLEFDARISGATPISVTVSSFIGEGTVTLGDASRIENETFRTTLTNTGFQRQSIPATFTVQSAVDRDGTHVGFVLHIKETIAAGNVVIKSNESSDIAVRPALVITYDPNPIVGFVAPHEHIFSEFGFGGGWIHGTVDGDIDVAAPQCDGGAKEAPDPPPDPPSEPPFNPPVPTVGDHAILEPDAVPTETCLSQPLLNKIINSLVKNIPSTTTAGDILGHTHRTSGYPDFNGWPRWDGYAHLQFHETWLKDAFDRGMNLIVMSATTFGPLCRIIPKENRSEDCDEMDAMDAQLDAAIAFASDHDWVEIALTPTHARNIIAAGNMVMVLHLETTDLFGNGTDLDQQLNKYWDLGVRSFMIAHQLDNRFSGVAHHNPVFFLWQYLRDCPNRPDCPDGATCPIWCKPCRSLAAPNCNMYSRWVGALGLTANQPGLPNLPLIGFQIDDDPESEYFCANVLGLTDEGEKLITKMINGFDPDHPEKRFIVDISHLSERSIDDVYKLAFEGGNNGYPLLLSHGHLREMTIPSQTIHEKTVSGKVADMVRSTGGILGLRTGPEEMRSLPGVDLRNECHGSSVSFAHHYLYGRDYLKLNMGLAPDMQGFAQEIRPLFGELGACSAGPNETERLCQRRKMHMRQDWKVNSDYDTKGFAHIGLIPDIVEQLDIFNVSTSFDLNTRNLMRSTEHFLRMWERALNDDREPIVVEVRKTEPVPVYNTPTVRNDVLEEARNACDDSGDLLDYELNCRRPCNFARGVCDGGCRKDKRQCKRDCSEKKRDCKSWCKEARSNCLDGCSTRACRKDCREAKRECTERCRKAKRKICKKRCKTFRDNVCLEQCATGLQTCLAAAEPCASHPYAACLCDVYLDSLPPTLTP